MDEDALFVMKDIPGDDDIYQDYSLGHLDNDHMHDCGCADCPDCGHHEEYSEDNYMIRPQLEMISQHAHDILQMVNSGKNLESWQESHIAQIADDMIEVLHSLTYTNH
jgi:hypothetical protein